jgi:hypothetical protein
MPFTAFHKKMAAAHRKLKLKPGDIYEDCAFHPVLCLGVDYTKDEVWGVSLVDGTHPSSCSLIHCGIRRLTPRQAWEIKMRGPRQENGLTPISRDKQWWSEGSAKDQSRVRLVGPRRPPPSTPAEAGNSATFKKRRISGASDA